MDLAKKYYFDHIPEFTNYEIESDKLPHEYLDSPFKITDIQYGPAELNWDGFDLKIVKHTYKKFFGLSKHKEKRIRLQIPLVNAWDMNFHVHTKSLGKPFLFLGFDSDVDLFLRDLYINLEGVWTINSDGKPEIDPSLIDLGVQHTKVKYYDSQYINAMI